MIVNNIESKIYILNIDKTQVQIDYHRYLSTGWLKSV